MCKTVTRRTMLSLHNVSFLLLVVLMLCGVTKSFQLEIQAFEPTVVPIRAITTLTLKTTVELNVTSNTSLQCRFKDISVPAWIKYGFVFCDTPPMRNTDRVSLHLDVNGKLFKAKRPLFLHEPFKVSNITPSVVSPAQNVHLTVSGISCKEWMQYFVRFQTANRTEKTQQGICRDSVVSCYVPEYPPNTRLRVGLTLTNRLVQWADRKILIQYPIDAIRSSVKDVNIDITKRGAFTFVVVLRDRFRNFIKVIKRDDKKQTRISVQYSSQDKPQSTMFLECSTAPRSHGTGDEYVLSCTGAEKESIYFYPSINNVPLGGQDKYEAKTTLCPGKNSCEAEPQSYVLVIALSCTGAVLVMSLVVGLIFVRYQAKKKQRVAPEVTTEVEMEVKLIRNVDRKLAYQLKNSVLETSDEEGATASPTQDDAEHSADSSELHLGVSGALEKCERKHQAEIQKKEGDENHEQSDKGIEIKHVNQSETSVGEVAAASPTQENVSDDEEGSTDSSKPHLGVSDALEKYEQEQQAEVQKEEGEENDGKSDEKIEMKIQHRVPDDSELSAANDSNGIADPSVVPSSESSPSGEMLTVTDGAELSVLTNGSNVSSRGKHFLDKARKQGTPRKKSRLGNNRVLPTKCDSITLGQTKYTERFKNADGYRQAWITSILGEDESNDNESEV